MRRFSFLIFSLLILCAACDGIGTSIKGSGDLYGGTTGSGGSGALALTGADTT